MSTTRWLAVVAAVVSASFVVGSSAGGELSVVHVVEHTGSYADSGRGSVAIGEPSASSVTAVEASGSQLVPKAGGRRLSVAWFFALAALVVASAAAGPRARRARRGAAVALRVERAVRHPSPGRRGPPLVIAT
jgi:hypothetical protein